MLDRFVTMFAMSMSKVCFNDFEHQRKMALEGLKYTSHHANRPTSRAL